MMEFVIVNPREGGRRVLRRRRPRAVAVHVVRPRRKRMKRNPKGEKMATKRRVRRRVKKKTPPRNSKGRFMKKRSAGKARRRRASAAAPKRRRRRAVAAAPKRRRRRRGKRAAPAVKRRRRRRASMRVNPAPKRRRRRRRVLRANPRRASRRRYSRRRRRNPAPKGVSRLKYHNELRAQLKAQGKSSRGTTAQLERRLAGTSRKRTKASIRKARRTRRKGAGRHAKWAYSAIRRRGRKPKSGRRRRSPNRQVARAYLAARRVRRGVEKGRIGGQAAKMARAMGLVKINPSWSALGKQAVTLLPLLGVGAGALVGGLWVGHKVGGALQSKLPAVVPDIIKNNAVPLTTLLVAALAWVGLKTRQSQKMQALSLPVGLGLGLAGVVQMLYASKLGQDLLGKMGIQMAVVSQPAGGAAPVVSQPGVGSYVAVPGYMGGLGEYFSDLGALEVDVPTGGSYYGRVLGGVGSYVTGEGDVHAAGPGDNQHVSATLQGLDDQGIFGGFGAVEHELGDLDDGGIFGRAAV